MEQFIKKLFREKTQNSNPATNTDLANSLELLSSGIYTEEERFIFELLQNAVDAYDEISKDHLKIRIVIFGQYLVFMHNGLPFTNRDIEGICSVGNGNKSKDIKKIGYKGIGFKSVFMHSDLVYIKSENTIFRFDKKYWDTPSHLPYQDMCSESGREYKMPWQIIPIYTEALPFDIDTKDFNVCTFICSGDIATLSSKVENLLSNCDFLLFLRNSNITIELYEEGRLVKSVGKSTRKIQQITDDAYQSEIYLYLNEKSISKWLVYKNENVEVPSKVKSIIRKDPKTPQKLQGAETYDVSFAISLSDNGKFVSLGNSVLYTYLPTSCHFGLPFLVNANFMTDAGRQQLVTDSEWNKMIIDSIPRLYLNWVATLSDLHSEYVHVLPSLGNSYKVLGDTFSNALKQSLEIIAFIPSLDKPKDKKKVSESIIDSVSLHNAVSKKIFSKLLKSQYAADFTTNNIISDVDGNILIEYGVRVIDKNVFVEMLSNSNKYLQGLTVAECFQLCTWMNRCDFLQENQAVEFLKSTAFLLDEDDTLSMPKDLFFPSLYRDENELAASAKFVSEDLLVSLEEAGLKDWLSLLGVQELSNLSLVENVLCGDGYINKNNAIEVLQFIFDVDKEEGVFDHISDYTLKNIKVLTTKDSLKSASELYLDQAYKSSLHIDFECKADAFISHAYIREHDEAFDWLVFFKKLGASDDIQVKEVSYERNTQEFKRFSSYADYAQHHEYNHSSWTGGNYYMFPTRLVVKFVSLLDNVNFDMSQFVFEKILCTPISFSLNDDYIFGSTGFGYTKKAFLVGRGNCDSYQYLGKNYFPWVIENTNILPATNGNLYKVQDIYENTKENHELWGTYLPVLDIQCEIHTSWKEYMPFKKDCSLNDCLDVLRQIWRETDEVKKKENVDRISLLYSYICDNFDLTSEANSKTISRWGKGNKILSTDKEFVAPSDLVMVSEDLGKLDIANQIYRGKHIENRSNRFATLMQAMGVSFISTFEIKYSDKSDENTDFKESLINKKYFLALLSAGLDSSLDNYNESIKKLDATLKNIRFVKNESITFVYGEQSIEKKVCSENGNFHYIGDLNVANIELLHHDIAKYLNITGGKAALMTILQMANFEEIKDYLAEKGYDVSLIPEDAAPIAEIIVQSPQGNKGEFVNISLSDTPYAGLSNEQRHDALIEAKEAVRERMESEGYEFTQGLCEDSYGNIYGVMKDGVEYPLVVHSYKNNNRQFSLNAFDWEQLAKPNSMLWVNTHNGVVCIPFYALAKDRGTINISFAAENFDIKDRSIALAQVLRYFKGLRFDFGTLLPNCGSDAVLFNKPEKPIREVLDAKDDNLMC